MKKVLFFNKNRIYMCIGLVLLAFFLLVLKLLFIQVVQSSKLKAEADKQHTKRFETLGKRGKIVAETGEEVAYDVEKYDIILDPMGMQEKKGTKKRDMVAIVLADVVSKIRIAKGENVDKNVLKNEISKKIDEGITKSSRYYLLEKGISIQNKKEIEEKLYDEINKEKKKKMNPNEEKRVAFQKYGISFDVKYDRVYPQEKKYENLAGYVNIDGSGVFGIERKFEEYLAGKKGYIKKQTSTGKIFELPVGEEEEVVEAKNGSNIVLTIDNYMQHVLSNELEKMFTETEAEWASAIIIECNTGRIKAMVSMPIDQNRGFIRNNAYQNQYEPGSIMKPIIMSSALDSHVINDNETFVSTGSIRVFDRVLNEHDSSSTGKLTLTDIIAKSSNVGMVLISQRFNREQFYDYLVKFGFSEKTGIDTFGEKKVYLRPPQKWDGVTQATMSYGHGIVVTQLQMAYALNAVFNGGILYKPIIVDKIIDEDGTVLKKFETEARRRVISQEVSEKLRKMIKSAVINGTGTQAAIPGYDIGGKTGTAKYSNGKGYEPGKYVSSFVGIYPSANPKYLALITVAKPKGKIYGGQVGAPVFRESFKKIFLYKNIKPDNESDEYLELKNADKYSVEDIPEISKIPLEQDIMPNLKGMRIDDAIRMFEGRNIDIQSNGRGVIVSQDPKVGSSMKDIKKVTINLEEKKVGGDINKKK